MGDLVVGVDLATANARVIVCDLDGRAHGATARPLPAPSRQGRRSRQRADYWPVVADLLAEQVAALGASAGRIRALAVTGTSGSLVPCDAAGRPVGDTSLYDDAVPAGQLVRLRASGVSVGGTSPLARLALLARQEPAATYLHTSDVVNAGLVGTAVPTDTSHALKEGVDLVHGTRDTALLALAGVDEHRLPALVAPGAVLGEVAQPVAERLGLPPGVQVVAGMTDGCTAQLAAGAVAEGITVGVLGTTLVLKAVSEIEVTALDGVVYSHAAPDGLFWPGGAANVGAGAVAAQFPGADLRALDEAARDRGPSSLVHYPLTGVGERFPFRSPTATAFTVPVGQGSTSDGRVDEYRSLLEGVAFVERLGLVTLECLGVRTGDHRVVGGGSASPVWNAIRASVLGRPVRRTEHPQSAFGAAVLAATALTEQPLATTTGQMVHVTETVDPVRAEVAALDERYHRLLDELRRRGLWDDTTHSEASEVKEGTR